MTLNEDLQKKAIKFLEKSWKGKHGLCSVCNTNKWNIHSDLYELRTFHGGNLVAGGKVVPLLVVECQNCGNTLMINAMKAGLVELPKKEGSTNE